MTFKEIYAVVRPKSPEDFWDRGEKSSIANAVRRGKITVPELLDIMCLREKDWTPARQREIAKVLNLKAK